MSDNDEIPPKTIFIAPNAASAEPVAEPDDKTSAEDVWFSGGAPPSPPSAPPDKDAASVSPAVSWPDLAAAPVDAAVRPAHGPPPAAEPRTVFMPAPPAVRTDRIQVGSRLNDIYEVRRFIARGGMGEVYEGVNVITGEQVAIKIILAHLANDENVLAMFLREARVLTDLNHPALVRYRLLAQEPTLGVLYIVTKYIDGPSLRTVASQQKPTAQALSGLIRRLAQGLEAAHELGIVHRDIAPDNILLPGGDLNRAIIIDFGITKDLDPGKGTIVGDGFAGKLDFVAPEQLGAFGRDVGPWTDVYSLGLVALSVTSSKPGIMGATLFDAIETRKTLPDLTSAPADLRPLIARMTTPDPKNRIRSMGEVIAAIESGLPVAPLPAFSRPSAVPPESKSAGPKPPPPLALLYGGGGAIALLILGLVAFAVVHKSHRPSVSPVASLVSSVAGADPGARGASGNLIDIATRAAMAADCSWLDVTQAGSGVKVSGAAGDLESTSAAINGALGRSGFGGATVTLDIHEVDAKACAILDAFRLHRQPSGETPMLVVQEQPDHQPYHLLSEAPPDCHADSRAEAIAIFHPPADNDFTILGVTPAGLIQQPEASRTVFEADSRANPKAIIKQPDGSYLLHLCLSESTVKAARNGLFSVLVVAGKGPFDLPPLKMQDQDPIAVPATWPKHFDELATQRGWKTQMVWFRILS